MAHRPIYVDRNMLTFDTPDYPANPPRERPIKPPTNLKSPRTVLQEASTTDLASVDQSSIGELRIKILHAKEILLAGLNKRRFQAKAPISLKQWREYLDLWDEQQTINFLRPIAGFTPVIEKATGQISGFLVTDLDLAIAHLEGRGNQKPGSKTPEDVAIEIMAKPDLKEKLKEKFGSDEFTKSSMLVLFRGIYRFEISDLSKVADKLIGSGLIIEIPNKDKRIRRLKLTF